MENNIADIFALSDGGKMLEDKKKYQDHAGSEIVKDSKKDREKDLQDQNKKQNAKGTQEKSAASKSGSEAKAGKRSAGSRSMKNICQSVVMYFLCFLLQ